MRKEWELLVGRFMLTCGDIELALMQLYWNLTLSSTYDERVKYDGLKEKANRILKCSTLDELPSRLAKDVRRVMNQAIHLADTRNVVAHSPLNLGVYLEIGDILNIPPVIRSLRNFDVQITLDALRDAVREAEDVSEVLSEQVVAVATAR